MTNYAQMHEYDVFLTSPRDVGPHELHKLAADLESARRFLAEARRHGKWGLIIPTCYRQVRITAERAVLLANAAVADLINTEGEVFSDLNGPADGGAWWWFSVKDHVAMLEEREPGTRAICIDKLDGHLVTVEEQNIFHSLSSPGEG